MMTRRALITTAALATLALSAAPSGAHAVLVRSAPAARAVLSRPPDRVELWFSEAIEPAFSTLAVWSASGARIDRGDVLVGPDDSWWLSVSVPSLEPGEYSVRFRVLSVDSHVVESSFSFTVRPQHAGRVPSPLTGS